MNVGKNRNFLVKHEYEYLRNEKKDKKFEFSYSAPNKKLVLKGKIVPLHILYFQINQILSGESNNDTECDICFGEFFNPVILFNC